MIPIDYRRECVYKLKNVRILVRLHYQSDKYDILTIKVNETA